MTGLLYTLATVATVATASATPGQLTAVPRPTDQAATTARASDARIRAKLRADLAEVLSSAGPEARVPITIVLRDQVPREQILAARSIDDKVARRAHVIGTLKSFAAKSQANLVAELRRHRATGLVERLDPMWIHNLVAARVTPELAYAIAARADVAHLNHDRPAGAEIFPVLPADEAAGDEEIECGVDLMRAPEVWNDYGIDGAGVIVGVIDTGLCLTHPDIADQLWTNPGEIAGNSVDDDGNGYVDDVYGWNFQHDNNNVSDYEGHGSHVAGTVAGDGTQGTQAGMAPGSQVMVLKFWNDFSGEQTVWDALEYGTENGADILTGSLGWPPSRNPDRVTWRTICENSMAAGVVVTFAAHNYGCSNPPDDVTTPGDVPDMITVGAVDCSDNKASFSSCGPSTWEGVFPWNDWHYPPGKLKPTIMAPGVSTKSHSYCSGYTSKSGTSMATPHVAGAMALMLSANPYLDHWDCKQILKATALDLGVAGPDNSYGYGRVDAYQAVQLAMQGGGLQLELSGSCPGIMTATVTGATQEDRIAFGYGTTRGLGPKIPGCVGLWASVVDPVLIGVVEADTSGAASIIADVPAAACDKLWIQAVNLDGCKRSNVLRP